MKRCLHCTHHPAWKNSKRDSSANSRGFCELLHCSVPSDHCCDGFHNYRDEIYSIANDIATGDLSEEEGIERVPYNQREYLLEVVGHIEDELRWAHDEAVLEEAKLHE